MKICYIVGAGSGADIDFEPIDGDLVIAADGGYAALKKAGIKPNIIVGDFDSLETVPTGEKVIRHPVEKDDTDMMLAVKIGISKGFQKFIIYGGTGGRLDHTFANIQALCYISKNSATGFLMGKEFTITAVTNGEVCFKAKEIGTVSVFSNCDKSEGVSIKGLFYPLDKVVLTSDFPLGVSNHFMGVPSSVSVENGTLIVMWTGNPDDIISGKLMES